MEQRLKTLSEVSHANYEAAPNAVAIMVNAAREYYRPMGRCGHRSDAGTPKPLITTDLAKQLSKATTDYEANWKHADRELYELSRRRPRHKDFSDVYPKVVIVGRVYAAGLSRSWRGKGDPEIGIANALVGQAPFIDEGLDRLARYEGHFSRGAGREIVELHRDVTTAISHRSGKFLTSFVSKYLHFHCPVVPIFDSRADAAMSKLIDRRGRLVRNALTELPNGIPAYRTYLAAFIPLLRAGLSRDAVRIKRQGTGPLALVAPAVNSSDNSHGTKSNGGDQRRIVGVEAAAP
jgi:hypothetical protein